MPMRGKGNQRGRVVYNELEMETLLAALNFCKGVTQSFQKKEYFVLVLFVPVVIFFIFFFNKSSLPTNSVVATDSNVAIGNGNTQSIIINTNKPEIAEIEPHINQPLNGGKYLQVFEIYVRNASSTERFNAKIPVFSSPQNITTIPDGASLRSGGEMLAVWRISFLTAVPISKNDVTITLIENQKK